MKAEIYVCQNCKTDFTIEPEDFKFYKNIKVPIPTWCPDCRFQRRFAAWNILTLYKDKCNFCKKDLVTVYDPEMGFNVFCHECYISDKWDPLKYGRKYNFSKNFFEQAHEFFKSVPRQAMRVSNAPNCDYCNAISDCKNCYMLSGGYRAENCMYSETPLFSKNVVDSDWITKGDGIYGSSDCDGGYNLRYCKYAYECLDSAFLFDCRGCSSCFGCAGLRNKKYYIFNKPYSKEDYHREMENWDLGSEKVCQKAKKEFEKIYYSTPRKYAVMTNAVNCTGENIVNAKNCKVCFRVIEGAENCKYAYVAGLGIKDSYDINGCGSNAELLYESEDISGQKIFFSGTVDNCQNVQYSEHCFQSKDLFSCMSLRNKKFCIFNKQYTEEQYIDLKEKIIKQMSSDPYVDKKGKVYGYGEFFPIEHSPFYYNKTSAYIRYPMTKNQALENGYSWKDEKQREYRVTLKTKDIPDNIKDVEDSIVKEVIECGQKKDSNENCTRAFRVTKKELDFYKLFKVPLPRLCPTCRRIKRMKKREPLKLWSRKCMCAGEQSKQSKLGNQYKNKVFHSHGVDQCLGEFQTAYSFERDEIVYCEECYNQEVV